MKSIIIGGGKIVDGKEKQLIGTVGAEKGYIGGHWVVETTDVTHMLVLLETIGSFKQPDLQYSRFEEFIEKPSNIVSFDGSFSGSVSGPFNFMVSDRSFMGTVMGAQDFKAAITGVLGDKGNI